MRRALLPLIAAALAACGPATETAPEPADEATAPTTTSAVPATRHAPAPPPADTERIAARLDELVKELSGDLPEGRTRNDVFDDVAALGNEGFALLLAKAGASDDSLDGELLGEVIRRLGPSSLATMARALVSGPGALRRGGLAAVGHAWGWPEMWQYLPESRGVVPSLLAALGDPDAAIRKKVLDLLGRSGPTDVPVAAQIAERVASPEPDESSAAFDALQELGPAASAAVPALLAALQHPELPGTAEAGETLIRIGGGSPKDVEDLLRLLKHSDAAVRMDAAFVLGYWRDAARAAVPALLPLLDDPDSGVADRAKQGLAKLARDPSAAAALVDALPSLAPADVVKILDDVLPCDGPERAAAAARFLSSADARVRATALGCLTPADGAPFDPVPVRPLLDDPDESVCAAAAWLLFGRDPLSRDRALAVASAAYASSGGGGRIDAADVLAKACDPAKPSRDVVVMLADDWDVRRLVEPRLELSSAPLGAAPDGVLANVASDALRNDGDPKAVLVALRFDGGAEAVVRAVDAPLHGDDDAVLRALAALDLAGPAAIAALPAVRTVPDHARLTDAKNRALFALTGDPSLLGVSFDGTADGARRLLAMGDAGATAIVGWAGTVNEWTLSKFIPNVVGDATLSRAIAAAAAAPGDDGATQTLREGAAQLAPALGPERGVALDAQLASDEQAGVRYRAAEALATYASADLAPATAAVRALLREDSQATRRNAVLAARKIPALVPDLRQRFADEDPSVRAEAAAAVLDAAPSDADARRVLFDVLARSTDDANAAEADWDLVGGVIDRMTLTAADAPALATGLRWTEDCGAQGWILRALPRLGADAAPALVGVRMALAGELPCNQGIHPEPPNRAEAIAALAAMGSAAAQALPDLRNVAVREPSLAAAAQAAIERIAPPVAK
jgi:HEAT repeat protein